MLSFFAVLCIVTLVLTSLFLLVLAAPQQRKHACNRILLALLLINALLILAGLSAQLGWFSIFDYPIPFFISRAVFFLIPPLLYLYVATFVDAQHPASLRHALPALVVMVALWIRFAWADAGAWLPKPAALTYFAGLLVSFAFYYVAALRILRAARTNLNHKTGKSRYTWMYATLLVFGIHWGFSMASGILSFTAQTDFIQHTESLSIFSLLIFCCVATYLGAQQLPAFAQPYPTARYASSGLDSDSIGSLAATLLQFIEKEKPYLDADLSVEKLASQINLTPRQLSQVLNDGLGQPFFDLINSYRVSEAKRLLVAPDHARCTILEILYKAGFNSKSAFHRVFRASTGTTPTQYRKMHSQTEAA